MALVTCPYCRGVIPAAVPTCIHCGQRLTRTAERLAGKDSPPRPREVPIIFHVKPSSSDPEYPTTAGASVAEYPFFPVSVPKFIALSLCTLGLYELYWCFKNWTRIKQRSGENLSPFWRAFFAPYWGFRLFRTMREHAQEQGISTEWSADTLGVFYVCLAMTWRLPDPWSLIAFASFLPFLPVLETVRQVNARASASEDRNESLSLSNFITLMLGGLVLVLTIVGSFATG